MLNVSINDKYLFDENEHNRLIAYGYNEPDEDDYDEDNEESEDDYDEDDDEDEESEDDYDDEEDEDAEDY